MNEAISETITHLQAAMKPLEEQLAAKKRLINSLLAEFGEPLLYTDVDSPTSYAGGPIRPDQYFGRPMATVVREILERRKAAGQGAISLADLYVAMKAGGFEFPTKDETNAKTGVATSLGKNPAFIKVPSTGFWGLLEWYPGQSAIRTATTETKRSQMRSRPHPRPRTRTRPRQSNTFIQQ
jgi:hypothetical protein